MHTQVQRDIKIFILLHISFADVPFVCVTVNICVSVSRKGFNGMAVKLCSLVFAGSKSSQQRKLHVEVFSTVVYLPHFVSL